MVTKDQITCKIIDFGSCMDEAGTEFEKKFDEERKKQDNKRKRPHFKYFVGTPNYMAPECVHNKETTRKSDSFSLGCLLYQLCIGFPPFNGKSEYLIFLKSTKCEFNIPDNEYIIHPDAADLIKRLVLVEPSQRLSIEEILEHRFIKDYTDKPHSRNYPLGELREIAYKKLLESLVKDFKQFRNISDKLETIKRQEGMNEENIRYGNKDNQIKIDLEEKEKLKNQYDSGLNDLENRFSEIKNHLSKANSNGVLDQSKKLILEGKLDFSYKQIRHDCFGIDIDI